MSNILTLHPDADTSGKTEHRAASMTLAESLLKIRKIIDAQQFIAEELQFATLSETLESLSESMEFHRLELLKHLDLIPASQLPGNSDDSDE